MASSSTWALLLEDLSLHFKAFHSLLWELKEEMDFSLVKGSYFFKTLLSYFYGTSLSVQITILLLASWSLFFLFVGLIYRCSKGPCKCDGEGLRGKTVCVTGGSSGIGFEICLNLARRGARVIMGCKSLKDGIAACKEIIESTGESNILVRKLDLSSMESVRFFSECILEEEKRLDILVLQETTFLSKKYMTEDNLELHMSANYFGHFLLSTLLYPLLIKSGSSLSPSRIVIRLHSSYQWGQVQLNNLNSEFTFEDSKAFAASQKANLYLARELSYRFSSWPILVNCFESQMLRVEPNGRIPSMNGHGKDISTALNSIFDFTPKEAAQTGIHLCVSEVISQGKIYKTCKKMKDLEHSDKKQQDDWVSGQLWSKTLEILDEPS